MNSPSQLLVQPTEVLSVSIGATGDGLTAVLTARIGEGTFESVNLAFSPLQANRILVDLRRVLEESKLLQPGDEPDGCREAFERIFDSELRLGEEGGKSE